MKRIRLFSLWISLGLTLSVSAYDFQSGDLCYNITSNDENYTVEVTSNFEYYSEETDNYLQLDEAFIPREVSYNGKTYRVTKIGNKAFKNSEISSIIISNSVTSIGEQAFHDTPWFENQPDGLVYINNWLYCYKGRISENKSIAISDGTIGIADNAFPVCYGLNSISIPNSVIYIGNHAFGYCYDLLEINIPKEHPVYSSENGVLFNKLKTNLICYPKGKTGHYSIPNSITIISDSAFSDCIGLNSINIPSGVKSIGDNTFNNCRSLTSISIPNSVTCIGARAFLNTQWFNSQTDGLIYINNILYAYKENKNERKPTSITILDGTVSIAGYAFYNCALSSVIIPSSVTDIGPFAFSGTSLSSISIPNGVTSIGKEAFSKCFWLTSVTIPSSVKNIGNRAFYDCSILNSITIPNGVTSIGEKTFYFCKSLKSISIPNSVTSIGQGAFVYCESLKSISIPNNVTSIGQNAFSNCIGLHSITIPSSVTRIENWAFESCCNLTSITVSAITPPIIYEGTFSGISRDVKLYVPVTKAAVYASAKYWRDFTDISY